MIRFGPAGWSYRDWEGVVYPTPHPRGFDPLAHLARYFDTVEVNSSFYHPPAANVARRWARRVDTNADFRFTAKLWRRFTHERGEAWDIDEVDQVREGLDPLAEAGRLGALLAQFPWSFKSTEEARDWLADLADAFAAYPLVVEVRHASWNQPYFYRWLTEGGLGFVNIDQPLFGRSIEPSAQATGRVGYVRLHGRNYEDWFREQAGRDARYDYLYGRDELEPWAERIRELADSPGVQDVYVVTNNHYRGQSVANALMLAAMIKGSPQPAPRTVVDSFADVVGGLVQGNGGAQARLL